MSHVASVIVWTGLDEEAALAPLNAWLAVRNYPPLIAVNDHAGGNKAVQADWWCGAFNYLDIPELVAATFAQLWDYPDSVCVIVTDEHDDQPKIYRHPAALLVKP